MTDRMLVSPNALLGFLGYGEPSAKLWFVGAEEGLGGATSDEENIANLVARCTWPEIADLRDAHLTLNESGRPIDVAAKRLGSTMVWRFMSRIALAAAGEDGLGQDSRVTEYVRHRLGRRGAQTFMTELNPVPAERSSRPTLLKNIPEAELQRALEDRAERQRELFSRRNGVTVCYGLGKRDEFADRFSVTWHPLSKKSFISSDGMSFLLPFFGQGALSKATLQNFCAGPAFQKAVSRSTSG